jgi:hypothetical protein
MLTRKRKKRLFSSVADPDPPEPRVFVPLGYGSGSISPRYGPYPDLDPSIFSKNSKKNLDLYCFMTSF